MTRRSNNLRKFGPFVFDRRTRVLLRGNDLVPLEPKVAGILGTLIERQGEVVTKDELLLEHWGDDVPNESALTRAISLMRKAFGEENEYIVTIPKRGYRFVAVITEGEEDNTHTADGSAEQEPPVPVIPPQDALRSRLLTTAGWLLIAVSMFCLCLIALEYLRHREPFQRRITTKPPQTTVKALAISPDGSYLAYAEKTGEGERTVGKIRHKSNGQTVIIPSLSDSEVLRLSWLPDSATLLVSGKLGREDTAGIWLVPVLAGAAQPLRVPVGQKETREATAMDLSHIAFVSGSRNEVWLMGMSGQPPRLILKGREGDEFSGLVWLKGGRRLLFNRLYLTGSTYEITVETLDLTTRQTAVVIPNNPRLRAGCASPSGRIYYSLEHEPPDQNDTSLWEMSVDPQTGEVIREARMIVRSNGSTIHSLSTTADGNHLALLKGSYQADVWVADIDQTTGELSGTRRLTHDDGNDLPTGWTPDSTAVFFHSNRGGRFAIYKHRLDSTQAERIIYGDDEDYRGARVSSDGNKVFYLARHGDWQQNKTDTLRLKISSVNGENPEILYERYALLSVRCASRSNLCVMGRRDVWPWEDKRALIFYDLARLNEHRELARIVIDLPFGQEYWDLSPDGSQLAVITSITPDGIISIHNLSPGSTGSEVIIKGRVGFQSIDWSPDGKGWFISNRSARSADLLYVDLQGNRRVMQQSTDGFQTWGVPSPDGRRLAILEWVSAGNIWVIDELPEPSVLTTRLLATLSVITGVSGLVLLFRRQISTIGRFSNGSVARTASRL